MRYPNILIHNVYYGHTMEYHCYTIDHVLILSLQWTMTILVTGSLSTRSYWVRGSLEHARGRLTDLV